MIDAAQRMEQTGGKARQSVVAGMGRYRRREGDQRKHRPTKRDIQGRSSFGARKPPVAMMNWAISATLVPARTFAKTKGRRSEERSVGEEWVRKGRNRGSPY